jgi:branched-chain amino acid transport system substrate-binding protein
MAGKPVELILEDDESKPAPALTKYEKLAKEDKVDVIAGWVLSNLGYSIAPYTDKYHVPTIFSVCSGDQLTKKKHQHWTLRTAWCSSQPSHPFGEYAFKKLHHKKIVTMGLDYPFGWETVGGFQRTFEEAGGQVVQKIWIPLGTTD